MEEYWEWLCSIPNLYRTQKELLLKCFKNPGELFFATENELNYLREKGCKWAESILKWKKKDPQEVIAANREAGILFVSAENEAYPERLHKLTDYPYGLFYKGDLPQEEKKAVAIVGARMCTREGKETASLIAESVCKNGGIVLSGGALGIDGAAQWSAMDHGGYSCAVYGCGADICYPSSHQILYERLCRQGCVISEFAPGTPAKPNHFPVRNRIISGLSDVVVVVEARKKSGSLITADFAASQGKNVFAVPGRPGDELSAGCNELINQGAGILLSVDEFSRTIFPENTKIIGSSTLDFTLAPSEKLVYSSLDLHSKSLWELMERTSLSIEELGTALLSLELRGLVRETDRNYYARFPQN